MARSLTLKPQGRLSLCPRYRVCRCLARANCTPLAERYYQYLMFRIRATAIAWLIFAEGNMERPHVLKYLQTCVTAEQT